MCVSIPCLLFPEGYAREAVSFANILNAHCFAWDIAVIKHNGKPLIAPKLAGGDVITKELGELPEYNCATDLANAFYYTFSVVWDESDITALLEDTERELWYHQLYQLLVAEELSTIDTAVSDYQRKHGECRVLNVYLNDPIFKN